jgi:hypothetical protein
VPTGPLDHTTIARFRQRHAAPLAELFGEGLALCAEAGLVRVGVIAVDGTKVAANASVQATRDYEQIAREILAEADAVDAEEDERFGDARGDELPPEFATAQGRRGWLRDVSRDLHAVAPASQALEHRLQAARGEDPLARGDRRETATAQPASAGVTRTLPAAPRCASSSASPTSASPTRWVRIRSTDSRAPWRSSIRSAAAY